MRQRVNKRSKACDISMKTKLAVFERDGYSCWFCGKSNNTSPNMHYRRRSQGGLGIEQNIMTACIECHHKYDTSLAVRNKTEKMIQKRFKSLYKDWNKEDLIYRKE